MVAFYKKSARQIYTNPTRTVGPNTRQPSQIGWLRSAAHQLWARKNERFESDLRTMAPIVQNVGPNQRPKYQYLQTTICNG